MDNSTQTPLASRLRLAAIVLVAIISVGIFAYLLNSYLLKSKASGDTVTVTFSPEKTSLTVNEEMNVAVNMSLPASTDKNKISAVKMKFDIGPNFQLVSASQTTPSTTHFNDTVNFLQSSGNTISGVVLALRPNANLTNVVGFNIRLRGKTASTGNRISTVFSQMQVVGVTGNSTYDFTLPTTDVRSSAIDIITPPCPKPAAPSNMNCAATCGQSIRFGWADNSNNETGFIVRAGTTELARVNAGIKSYLYAWCADHVSHSYSVTAYNTCGESTATTVSCVCPVCANGPTPTLIPTPPPNTANLKFRIRMPDVYSSLTSIPNVRVEALTQGQLACPTCTKYTSLVKEGDYYTTPVPVTFDLEGRKSYTIRIKQYKTISRSFSGVILSKGTMTDCTQSNNSQCGAFVSLINTKPLLSGDTDGFTTRETNPSYNKIDETDMNVINNAFDAPNAAADVNMDGRVDIQDLNLVGKNYGVEGD